MILLMSERMPLLPMAAVVRFYLRSHLLVISGGEKLAAGMSPVAQSSRIHVAQWSLQF
jgi:hypothetical protein